MSCSVSGIGETGGLHYSETNGEIRIISSNQCDDGHMVIPGIIDGKPVTAISSYAFTNCSRITSVRIPGSVKSIGKAAFAWCYNLKEIIVEPSNTVFESIDGVLFNKADGILMICLTGKVGHYTVPGNITSIADRAFAWCRNLVSVTIPESVSYIGKQAFYSCSDLSEIIVSPLNTHYSSVDGVLLDRDQTILIKCPSKMAGIYEIPDGVSEILDGAFRGCGELTKVDIPDSVLRIGDEAFIGCSTLDTLAIPENVTRIGMYSFSGCSSLTQVSISARLTRLEDALFAGCESLVEFTVPDSVTSIGNAVFSNCSKLSEIHIPDGVKNVGSWVFQSCSSLKRISFPASVQSIGGKLFSDCVSLIEVSLPPNIRSIDKQTFMGCSSLQEIRLPSGVTSIGNQAFNECSRLSFIVFPENLKTIGSEAFSGCVSLTEFSIPASVTEIGLSPLERCFGLSSIEVEAGNQRYLSLGGVLFDKNQSTIIQYPAGKSGEYTVPDGVGVIESQAFKSCIFLTEINIPDGVHDIREMAFTFCRDLKSFQVADTNPAYRSYEGVLYDGDMTTLLQYPMAKTGGFSIPEGVKNINEYALMWCDSLTSVTMPASLQNLVDIMFIGCYGLRSIYFRGHSPVLEREWHGINKAIPFTVYYLPGSLGWPDQFLDRPTAVWLPRIQIDIENSELSGIPSGPGINVHWAEGQTIHVEVTHSLTNPTWEPVISMTLDGDSYSFTDPDWEDHPNRFYRVVGQ